LEEPDIRQMPSPIRAVSLSNYPAGAILDESKNTPDLFSYIQSIVDENQDTNLSLPVHRTSY